MKVFEIQGSFGLDNLKVIERPDPTPGHGQILLQMRAASVNFRDLMMVAGLYNPKQSLPLIPCSDGVGEVVAVGEGTSRFKEGDRVAALFCQRWIGGEPTYEKLRSTLGGPLDGTLAEMMVLNEGSAVLVPEHLSDQEAATLPCAGLTAWSALAEYGDVAPGDTVLVQGTGGVSIFALQFTQLLGARAIVTSSSDDKLKRARKLGAWQEINYVDDSDWGKTARELTGGVGVDHVVDVGGGRTLEQSLRAVRIGGEISLVGALSGATSDLNLVPIFMKNVKIQGIVVGSRDGFERMNRAIAMHEMRPVVDRVFPFAEAPEVFRYMQSGFHFGKLCIEFDR
jgi:NADPH:quinone reductase-like Zn-dependent oxidoreductase